MKLSIVMVSYGASTWTEQALAAVAEHTPVAYEVIVVDNASPDGTADEVYARLPDVRLVATQSTAASVPQQPGGRGRRRAGPAVLPEHRRAGRTRLVRAAAAAIAADVAAAVPCVLELSGGIVQCAGALLGRDGTVIEYGNGLAPDALAVRFARAVDFGPAACLVVAREAFAATGGFDDRYAPAYYEDADLCLALAGRTLCVPDATVRHAKKASGGADLAQQLSERHRAFFAERWQQRLRGRPATLARPTEQILLAARDAPADGRILVRDPRVLDELLATRPFARISLVGDDEAWLPRGVELITPEIAAARRLHYDVELDGRPDDLPRALAAGGLL